MRVKKELGELLVEWGIISESQLQNALSRKRPSEPLEQVLIKLNYVNKQDIINVLKSHQDIPQVKLSEKFLDERILKLLPVNIAERCRAIPVGLDKNTLIVAMSDPLDWAAIDEISLATGYEVKPTIVKEEELKKLFQQYYSFKEPANGALKELEINAAVDQPVFQELKIDLSANTDAPIVKIVNSIIHQAVYLKASDIHFEPLEDALRVRFRIDGILKEIMTLPKVSSQAIVSRLKIMANMDIAEKRLPQDGRIQLTINNTEIDLRCSSIPTILGEKIALRILDKSNAILSLDKLGLTPEVLTQYKKLVSIAYGMILLTGPAGSGKTTTLYATLKEIDSITKNIVTIEDPVEYLLPGINQIGVNQKAGLTFAGGLKSILRQDPDIILVGEIRDPETANIAVRAATTGHLVLSTLHTNDAAGALPRLIHMGVENYLVASALAGVVAQRLVRKICPYCKEEYLLPVESSQAMFMGLNKEVVLFRGRGCTKCDNTGYLGRMAIHELLPVTGRIRKLIMEKASSERIKQAAIAEGMISLKDDGIIKALKGLTTIDEVMRVANID